MARAVPSVRIVPAMPLLMLALLPLAVADTAQYRPLEGPLPPLALPPLPGPPLPTLYDTPAGPPAIAPCFVDAEGALHCTPVLAWEAAAAAWGSVYQDEATGWLGESTAATVGYVTGLDVGEAAGALVADEFIFLGPAGTTAATIHVHDAAAEGVAVFVVKGGPSGERWVCRHSCTVPDVGFRVSVDPLDVPPNIWAGSESAFPLPNLPATSGTITVTFS